MIAFEHVSKRYDGGVKALQDDSTPHVPPGCTTISSGTNLNPSCMTMCSELAAATQHRAAAASAPRNLRLRIGHRPLDGLGHLLLFQHVDLIELPKVPERAKAIELAEKSVAPGTRVDMIGNPIWRVVGDAVYTKDSSESIGFFGGERQQLGGQDW